LALSSANFRTMARSRQTGLTSGRMAGDRLIRIARFGPSTPKKRAALRPSVKLCVSP
jgi:hypothetical protein